MTLCESWRQKSMADWSGAGRAVDATSARGKGRPLIRDPNGYHEDRAPVQRSSSLAPEDELNNNRGADLFPRRS